jgi:SAM-dependent methyltransferase
MEKIYREIPPGKIPWNLETPPELLQSLVADHVVNPCRAIELGCGTGNNVLYLSRMGFDAAGMDISETAIDMARRSAEKAGARCTFYVADALGDLAGIPGGFDFAYDWELLHHVFPEDRKKYLQNVWNLLKPGGRYLSVCFSEKSDQFGGVGKYRSTPLGTVLYFSGEAEVRSLFEDYFRVDELRTVEIKGKHAAHKAIYALSRKKNG